MPRVRCHRRGKQNPPASVAQTETPRNSSRLENSAWNSLRDRALATGRPLAPAAGGRPRRHYTSYGAPWDNGISLKGGIRTNVDLKYFVHAPVIFGVPFFARECAKVAERYGVKVHYQHNLVAVDAKAKTALFEI